MTHRDELIAEIESAFADAPTATWLQRLDEAGIPSGKVRFLDEVYAWEQTRSQGLLIEVDHPVLGRIELPGPPLRFDGAGAMQHRPPPALGADNDRVLAWLDEADEADEADELGSGVGHEA